MKPRKPIRKVSNKRAKQNREYSKVRAEFLKAHPWCQVQIQTVGVNEEDVIAGHGRVQLPNGTWMLFAEATEIHHKRGRFRSRLCESEYFLACSEAAHRWIHNNPKEAYAAGFMLPR